MYKVYVVHRASNFMHKLDSPLQSLIVRKLRELEQDPRPAGYKRVQGYKDFYRVRCVDYRIVYTIRDTQLLVLVIQIGHRRDVYRKI